MNGYKESLNDSRLYYRGTCLDVEYAFEGIVKRRKVMLAECYEEEKVFQVIDIQGYDAGTIFGYIPVEFEDAECVTYEHLERMINEYVFPNVISLKISDGALQSNTD